MIVLILIIFLISQIRWVTFRRTIAFLGKFGNWYLRRFVGLITLRDDQSILLFLGLIICLRNCLLLINLISVLYLIALIIPKSVRWRKLINHWLFHYTLTFNLPLRHFAHGSFLYVLCINASRLINIFNRRPKRLWRRLRRSN